GEFAVGGHVEDELGRRSVRIVREGRPLAHKVVFVHIALRAAVSFHSPNRHADIIEQSWRPAKSITKKDRKRHRKSQAFLCARLRAFGCARSKKVLKIGGKKKKNNFFEEKFFWRESCFYGPKTIQKRTHPRHCRYRSWSQDACARDPVTCASPAR